MWATETMSSEEFDFIIPESGKRTLNYYQIILHGRLDG